LLDWAEYVIIPRQANKTKSQNMSQHIKKEIDTILKKELSRKEFLQVAGAAFLGIVGVTGFMQNLHKLLGKKDIDKVASSGGYGSSPYGH
jgi:hypothetical protein